MDSNRKTKYERSRTPVHLNISEYNFKGSAGKKFTPNLSRRPNLNETVCARTGTSDPKFKTKLSTVYAVNYETECDIAYNDYLQALLKKQLLKKNVAKHKEILEEQLIVQSEKLHKRNQNYEEIIKDTETIQKQGEVVEMINFLQRSLTNLENVFTNYDIELQVHKFKEMLELECDKVILRNVKILGNQEEYDQFMNTLRQSLSVMEKIINSGREFEEIHNLAENIRSFIQLKNTVQESRQTVSKLESDGLYYFLQNTSDLFAKKYNNETLG